MSKVDWRFNMAGFRALRTSAAMRRDVESRASRIAARAGDGMEVRSGVTGGRGRARAVVVTATSAARRAEASDRRLTSSVDAGR